MNANERRHTETQQGQVNNDKKGQTKNSIIPSIENISLMEFMYAVLIACQVGGVIVGRLWSLFVARLFYV